MANEAEFPIRLHLHLHPRPGRPFPPLELHLYDCETGDSRTKGVQFASGACNLTIDLPTPNANWNVVPDASGSATGYICAVVQATNSDGSIDKVLAAVYDPGDSVPSAPPVSAASASLNSSGLFVFDRIEGAKYSSGGVQNRLVVWASCSGTIHGWTDVLFNGVAATVTSCNSTKSAPMAAPPEVPVQSERYGIRVDSSRVPRTAEARQLVAAFKAGDIELTYEGSMNRGIRKWSAPPRGPLGTWLLQLENSRGRIHATLILSSFEKIPGVKWECSKWSGQDEKVFVPVDPENLRSRLPALIVVAR